MAGELATAAALDYLKSEHGLREFPVQRFVNFKLIRPPTYISIRPPPTKVSPNGSKVWRLAESEVDKLRGEPLSVRYPDIERHLAAHSFLKGMIHITLSFWLFLQRRRNSMRTRSSLAKVNQQTGLSDRDGTVVLERKTSDGKPVVIDTVSAGEPLGWSWLFPPYLWQFDVRATEVCTAICLSGIMLRQHRDEDLTLSHELFKRASEVMVRRLHAVRGKLVSGK